MKCVDADMHVNGCIVDNKNTNYIIRKITAQKTGKRAKKAASRLKTADGMPTHFGENKDFPSINQILK